MISRRAAVLALCFAAAGCASPRASEPPFLGRWRDVLLGDEYVFQPNGWVDFRPAPASDPDFERTTATARDWRVTVYGRYEVVERTVVFDAEPDIVSVWRVSIDGPRLVLRSRDSQHLLERAD